MIKLFTIGFTEKSAEQFFDLLKKAGVKKIIDTRVNNSSQLSGFAKGSDLEYFAKQIAQIKYEHNLDFAPTKELLTRYRDKEIGWDEYSKLYVALLEERDISRIMNIKKLHRSCLLCSEHTPERCHRRLLAEYLQKKEPGLEIIHLVD